jgi:aspartyl-tRNA(Asn)/glutamyl-tRNA(Gln) amidotransferase subunit B
MRGKEEAHDYRYFPDPDLVPVTLTDERIEQIRAILPELPDAKKRRYVEELGLSEYDAGVLTAEKGIADFFEACLAEYNETKKVCNLITSDVLRLLNESGIEPDAIPAKPAHLVETLKLIDSGQINTTVGKAVFEESFRTGENPANIVKRKRFAQINDTDELRALLRSIIEANPGPLADYKGGKQKALTFFVGQVMKATKGQANPQIVNALAKEELDKA